jgi:hypothetical protein
MGQIAARLTGVASEIGLSASEGLAAEARKNLQTGGGNAAIELLNRIEDGYTQLAAARQARPPDEAEIQRLEVLVGDVVNQYKNLPIRSARSSAAAVSSNALLLPALRSVGEIRVKGRAAAIAVSTLDEG